MRRMYEFKCRKCGQVFTDLVEEKHRLHGVIHEGCLGRGDYLISSPYFKEGIESDKWLKNRESHIKKEQKNMANHGTYD